MPVTKLAIMLASLVAMAGSQAQAARPAAAAAPAGHAPAGVPPVSAFAKLPFIEKPALSPDGMFIAGLFGVPGGQMIGIKNLFSNGKMISLGIPDGMQVRWIRWVNADNIILGVDALRPVEGDNWYISRLISINTRTAKVTRLLWDLNGQNTSDVLWTPSDGSDEILVAAQGSIYLEADFWPSVYRVNVKTGQKTKVLAGRTGVNNWSADNRGKVRAGIVYDDKTRRFRLIYRGTADGESFRTIDSADTRKREVLQPPFLFLPDGDQALVMHDDAKGRSGIYQTDLRAQKDVATVFAMPESAGNVEVAGPLLSDDGTTLLGAATTRPDGAIHWIDPNLAALQAQFQAAVGARQARIVSFSADRSRMLVMVGGADSPGTLYYYHVEKGALEKVAAMNPDLGAGRLGPVRLIRYRARDGVEIEGVLTLPKGADARALPFIVMPHGGPWGRDGLDYDYWAQFLASRGYAVLQPNFRGSTGYGTEFLHKGEGQLGLAMQDDVTDGVRWAVAEGIADARRVCIIGGSYGGYAAMWGIAKDPDLYRCAISIAGVSSLRREVNDFGGNLMGGKYKDDWTRMTPDFDAVSPFHAVDRITAPLLLIHGRKDVRVDASQSARMFTRMKNAGKTVDYVPLPLADHYFTREADRAALLAAMEGFLDKHNPATRPGAGSAGGTGGALP